MILFFSSSSDKLFAVQLQENLSTDNIKKLEWLFGNASYTENENVDGFFVGPRKEMITPWSTNAVEITMNMGLEGLERIEEFQIVEDENASFDPMLEVLYHNLNQEIFTINQEPEKVIFIEDIESYNQKEGLALSKEEIGYLT
ncbi:MAG: phosphoribosylformylglycinamidine synthase, partial [Flavobacteriales bacterium]